MNYNLKIYKVFANAAGEFGNKVAIVVDEQQQISQKERQKIASDSGCSETIFIDSVEDCVISIYTPLRKIIFAGHAVIGAAYFLGVAEKRLCLTSGNKKINAWNEDDIVWIETDMDQLPDWNMWQLESSEQIETISKNISNTLEHTMTWAYTNEPSGIIRARTFAPDWGIPEDEANGSGSMLLAHQLERDLVIMHGRGSMIRVQFIDRDCVRIGGIVLLQK